VTVIDERQYLKQFDILGLAEPLLRAVLAEGYVTPTPIQAEVIPAMLAGQDVLGTAQTGTGKTAAFVLPLLHRIGKQRGRPNAKTCNTLILTPTRELASQIAGNIRDYSRFMRVSVAVVVGGVKLGPQIRALAPGVNIVVATPGRLLDHLSSGGIRLDQTSTIVLDEADQMLDLGFMPAIRRILAKAPEARQTILMSATMPPQIRKLARDFQKNPVEIAVAAKSRPIELIAQSVVQIDNSSKREMLTDILAAPDVTRAIVFTRTKRGADRVNQHLQKAGLSAAAIHGNKSQMQRERALAAFRSGETAILVATDIAARGIDVDDVSHVVNYELPDTPEAYIHRIGRTARAGRTGIAISLCDPAERGLLRDIERKIGNPLERSKAYTPSPANPVPSPAPAAQRPRHAADSPKSPNRVKQARVPQTAPAQGKPARRRKRNHRAGAPTAGLARMLGNIGPVGTAAAAAERQRQHSKSTKGRSTWL
jgi:ATP-dependent RNA helicase RhlE